MKILVLGANGFIGSHVAGFLRRAGHDVGQAAAGPAAQANGFILLHPEHTDYAAIFGQQHWDVCINCTGAASVPASWADPARDFQLNTAKVLEMLEGLRKASPQTRFVHISSAAVYGNPEKLPISEDAPSRPVSPYGWHKMQAEQICREYVAIHGMQTLSLRVFSAFGPGLRKQLFWDVYQKARANTRLELFGTGRETRDFIFVEDLAACIELLIHRATFDGRVLNVGSGESIAVKQAISTLLEQLGWERELVFSGEERAGDPCYWRADIGQIKSIGFQPSYTLADGLAQVAQWMHVMERA